MKRELDLEGYNSRLLPHRRALAKLRLDFSFYLEESGPILVVGIEHRTKSFANAERKATKLGISLLDLDDLAGLRVICGTSIDADMICHFFKHGLRGSAFSVLKDQLLSRSNGYRARHIVIELDPSYTGTWQCCKVEVQVHTALQNAFNKISRHWLYKSDRNIPKEMKSRLTRITDSASKLDNDITHLQMELIGHSDGHRDSDQINPVSYRLILLEVLREETDSDSAIWQTLFYRRYGITTCGDLRELFGSTAIADVYNTWIARSEDDEYLQDWFSTKQDFWQQFGLHLDRAKRVLEHRLKTRAVPKA